MGKTKIEPRKREIFQEMLSIYQPKNMKEFSDMFKDMFAEGIQQALEGELEEELGYSRYDYKNKETENSRNGYGKKKLATSMGQIEISVPRDRNGEFEPQIIKKRRQKPRTTWKKKYSACTPKG